MEGEEVKINRTSDGNGSVITEVQNVMGKLGTTPHLKNWKPDSIQLTRPELKVNNPVTRRAVKSTV